MDGTLDVWAVFLCRVRHAVWLTSKLIWKLHVVLKGTRGIVWAVKVKSFRQKLEHDSASVNQCIEVVNLGNIPKLPCTEAACCGTLCYFWLRFLLVQCRLFFHSNATSEPLSISALGAAFVFLLLNETVQLVWQEISVHVFVCSCNWLK